MDQSVNPLILFSIIIGGLLLALGTLHFSAGKKQRRIRRRLKWEQCRLDAARIGVDVCRGCGHQGSLKYFGFVVCRVVGAVETGGHGWWSHDSSYRNVGTGGGHLCQSCRRLVFLKHSVLPFLLFLGGLTFFFLRHFASESWVNVCFFLAIICGLLACWEFLKVIIFFKNFVQYEVQDLCHDDVAKQFGSADIYTGDKLPRSPGGLRLFTPRAYGCLRRMPLSPTDIF
jgi:hypothetical protein